MVRNNNNGACTLYFYGKDKYGHTVTIPLIIGNTRMIDEYVAYCINYTMLFNFLPDTAKELIKNNFCDKVTTDDNECMSKHFRLVKAGNTKPLRFIFKNDEDVLYCDYNDIIRIVSEWVMSESEYNNSKLKSGANEISLIKYDFFKTLYETYVKPMNIDRMLELKGDDEGSIHSVATSEENIKIIIYNAWQKTHDKRRIAWMVKDVLTKLNKLNDSFQKTLVLPDELQRRFNKRTLNVSNVKREIINNVLAFWSEYLKDYEISDDYQRLDNINLSLSQLNESLLQANLNEKDKDKIEARINYLKNERDKILYYQSLIGSISSKDGEFDYGDNYDMLAELMGQDISPYDSGSSSHTRKKH